MRELQPEFGSVTIDRRVAGPMAGGLYPEYALLIIIALQLAQGFLSEAGKDAYRGFRAALYAAYKKARTWANGRGYGPMGIEVSPSASDQGASGVSAHAPKAVFYSFTEGLTEDQFHAAFGMLLELLDEVDAKDAEFFAELEFDADAGAWTEVRRE